MRHETLVTEVPLAELDKVLQKRFILRWHERNPKGIETFDDDGQLLSVQGQPTADEIASGARDLLDGYRAEGLTADVAYAATCKCGWEANNPLPHREAAEADAEAHITSIYGEA